MRPEAFAAICLARYGYGWQTRLANEIGVAPRTVRRWASGEVEIPAKVLAGIQARPRIAIDYPDKWLLADGQSGEEYIIHLQQPRFVGLVTDSEELASGMTLSLRDESVVSISWIDPEPAKFDELIQSLQAFMDEES